MCCDSWGRKESDTTKQLNGTDLIFLPLVTIDGKICGFVLHLSSFFPPTCLVISFMLVMIYIQRSVSSGPLSSQFALVLSIKWIE